MATLVYSDAGGGSSQYQLGDASILIGASAECAIRSDGPLLAAQHARLFPRDGEYWIEDLGSSSGVFVGETRVSQSRVPFGEVIVVGSLILRIDAEGGDASEFDPASLVKMLAAAGERQKQLEEERNALGARLGELHGELAQTKKALEEQAREPTVPSGGFDPVALEKLGEELRAAEKARRDLEAKINSAQRKRSETQNEMLAAQADTQGGDTAEIEVKQVQLLALNAQLAEADRNVERLRGQLKSRNQEIAALRERARKQTGAPEGDQPRTTQPYTVPAPAEDPAAAKKLAELKERFESEFARAVTLQQKLKTAEERIATVERSAKELGDANAKAAQESQALLAERASEIEALKKTIDMLESRPDGSEESLAQLEVEQKKASDLKKLLEGAQRESSGLRSKLNAAKEEALKAAKRAEALEGQLGDSAASVIEQAEKLVELGAQLEERTAMIAAKDRELTDMAAAVAISAEKTEQHEKVEKRLAELEAELAAALGAVKKSEASRDAALAARRELEARAISAKSEVDESRAKLDHAERRVKELQADRERAEAALEAAREDLTEARDARLAAEQALAEKNPDPNRDNTAVVSLKRRIFESEQEASNEIDRLTNRLREVETDLDRALDAEQAALARADADGAAVADQLERITEERDKVAAELEIIGGERDTLLSERNQLRNERNGLRSERDRAVKALERSQQELQATSAELDAKSAELDAALEEASNRASADEAEDSPAQLRERVLELASQNAKLSSEVSALQEQAGEREVVIAELEETIGRLHGELDQTTTARNALEAEKLDLTRRYEEVAEKLLVSESVDIQSSTATKPDRDAEDLLREVQGLRERVAELELELDIEPTSTSARVDTLNDIDDIAAMDDIEGFTTTSPSGELIEWMNNLHEAIADLRREMRAASDEAAVLPSDNDSVDIINNALSSAVARVEAARDALSRIAALVGLD